MSVFCVCLLFKVIAASGAVKHEDFVEQVKKLFTKLSTNPTTASQLVEKEPAIFTGSEVRMLILILSTFENRFECFMMILPLHNLLTMFIYLF
jgi:predicted Zn-dependent peptidase